MRSEAEGPAPERRTAGSGGRRSFWKELPVLIAVALIVAFVIRTFFVQAFSIPSGSMENTLRIGDRVLVNKIVYRTRDIQRGDIVVFNGAGSWDESDRDYIKRVIGIPGDIVKWDPKTKKILVNGEPLEEDSYLHRDPGTGELDLPSDGGFGPEGGVKVPEGRLWVMGDHRENSSDSRSHEDAEGGGTIPISRVVGRAFVAVWPIGHWKVLGIPATFT